MGFVDPELAGSQMTIPKFRAAIVVFIIGFALGLSVFVASRLVVRSVLSADAVAAAEEVAAQLAKNNAVEATGTLSSVVQYRYFDGDGNVVASESPKGAAELPLMSDCRPGPPHQYRAEAGLRHRRHAAASEPFRAHRRRQMGDRARGR